MNAFVLGDFVLDKSSQPDFVDSEGWREEFQLD